MRRYSVLVLTLNSIYSTIAWSQLANPEIPENIRYQPNVAYDNADPQQVMDIFQPTDGANHPAVLFIHGGGFRAGSRKGYIQQCIRMAQ